MSGCYTVIWMPEDEFPSEIATNEYYPETYYGDYYSFYDYPWWLSICSSKRYLLEVITSELKMERTSSIRNEGQGRGNR